MGFLWDLYGIYVGFMWDLYRIYVGCIWDLCGIYMGFNYMGFTIPTNQTSLTGKLPELNVRINDRWESGHGHV